MLEPTVLLPPDMPAEYSAGAEHSQSTLLATSKHGVSFARINGNEDSCHGLGR